ncbi:uncharacterized protein BDR25DRAFT_300237 [Lindgomyces ingoldianus]|uniref:Uncharacterized protein n=1 Tax=Lindgomyces ingoldianus TaxID=673940 RepID=A0ACB6RDP1_9PLEO|nr:uncharacterized protein BDR25DRAFT_300237 [Lindgomyces ingoldianus]KAF2477227.1 hypothetical protein BDR25DRAFT_300237 [Lindgomyces ingoldianus]
MDDRITRDSFKKSSHNLRQVAQDHGTLEKDLTLPAVFQQAGPWIALAEKIIQSARIELDKKDAKPVGTDLRQCSQTCREKSELLELVFGYVATAEAPARRKTYAEAVAQDKERAVELVLGRILGAIADAIKSGSLVASDSQNAELGDALKKLSGMAAKNSEGGPGINFYGIGDQITNLADGKISVGKDHAVLYIGDNVNVGVAPSKP